MEKKKLENKNSKKTKKTTRKKKDINYRREEVFNAILDILSKYGMNGLSTTKIAKKLGISQPALYRYFKNKDDMFILFFDELKNKLGDIVEKAGQKKGKGNKIISLLELHFKFIRETEAIPSIMFSGYLFKSEDKKRKKMGEVVKFYRNGIEKIFIEEGMPDEYLPIASDLVIGTLLSFVIRWLSEENFEFENYLKIVEKYILSFLQDKPKRFDEDVMI